MPARSLARFLMRLDCIPMTWRFFSYKKKHIHGVYCPNIDMSIRKSVNFEMRSKSYFRRKWTTLKENWVRTIMIFLRLFCT